MSSRFCIHYVSKSGRPGSGHRTEKGQSSSQFPRKVVPKNVLTIRQLHSSPMLVKSCLKSCMLGFSIMLTKNFQMSKLGLEKEEELKIKLSTFTELKRKQGNPRKISTSVSLSMLKPLALWIMTNYGKLLERWEYQTILPVSWKTCMWIKKQQLEPCMEQQLIGSRSRKKYDRAVCCHPVCLTYMLSKSWLQSPSAVILEPPKIKSFTVTIVSPSICHEVMGPYAVIEAMKLKDACSLEEKLWPTYTAYLKQETLLFQ